MKLPSVAIAIAKKGAKVLIITCAFVLPSIFIHHFTKTGGLRRVDFNPILSTTDNQSYEESTIQGVDISRAGLPDTGGNSESDLPEPGLPSALRKDIFVVNDGITVLLSGELLDSFYRTDCPSGEQCGENLPCVDVSAVREYVVSHLMRLIEGPETMAVAKNRAGEFTYRKSDYGVDNEGLVKDITTELSFRIDQYRERVCQGLESAVVVEGVESEGKSTVIYAGRSEMPSTDGYYAPKYLELDDSQQHIYAWENGRVVADYEVSGFYDEYAVYGVFEIKNKSLNAWSPIAEKWMPYWMAYYFDPKQKAWFGIHELVWWTDENGKKIEESSDSIGNKKSGGCVRLDRGEAKELYDWADVGIPLLIHL